MNVFGKAGKAFCLVPSLEVLIATITPVVRTILPIAHQTLPIAMAKVSPVLLKEVVPDEENGF